MASLVVGVVAALLITLAVVDPGLPATDPRLHDGSVYVTNSNEELLGKFNRQIDELSGSAALGREGDVRQDGNDVLTVDPGTKQLTQVDPGSLGLGAAAQLPPNAEIWLHAGQVVVSDRDSGAVWLRPIAQIGGLQFPKIAPDLELGPGGRTVQGVDGTAYGLSLERNELVEVTPDGPRTTDLGFEPSNDLDLTVVGDTVVILDRGQGLVWTDGSGTVELPEAATARLQQPSARVPEIPDAEISVVLATPQGLYGVGRGGFASEAGLVELGAATGQPTQPVVVDGCAYGAFSSEETTTVVTRCDRTSSSAAEATGWTPGNAVVFRHNRDEIVLNDVVSGDIWLVTEDMRLIEGWDKVTPPKEGDDSETENTETIEMVNPNRSRENRPPVAEDDALTVRAGRTTVLPVTDNDSDPDGDILTFAEPAEISQGTLGLTRGGTALQLTLPEEASGRISFSYTVEDGRGGKATARVSVQVASADQAAENQAPFQRPLSRTVTVRSGGDVTTRVLLDWRDPEGDDLVLLDATIEGDDEVSTTRDGQLTFRDAGTEEGRKEVTVTVSDGLQQTTGTVIIQTVAKAVPPIAYGDFVTARTGEEITVNPLLNDVGDDLILARIDEAPSGVTVALSGDETFTFSASKAGTYYLSYVVSNGPRSFGLIRIDVHDAPEENRPPVPARDLAQLPAGGAVLVDPLANDEDPDNDVLVIQQVSTDEHLDVRILRRSQLQITAARTPERPVVLTYTVSDGVHSVPGSIVVMPTKLTSDAPRAKADTLTVRAGDVGSVRVLANDLSPSGLDLELLGLTESPSGGQAWTDGELLRFRAPSQPGEYNAVYEIADAQGRKASAQVRIFVIAESAANTAPVPETVVDRFLAGTRNTVVIPLRGIDAEGDSTRLTGIDVPPELGRIVSLGDGQIGYEAYPDAAGTDVFRYRVADAHGATAIGTVRIGVVPRGSGNAAPLPVDDAITGRPGQTLRIPVLDNDSDPDGDPFGFATEEIVGIPDAKVVDGRIVQITLPDSEGELTGTYTVVDSRGAESSATIRVVADEDAPLQAPELTDDLVPAWEVQHNEIISVAVLDNDFDPDGDITIATVSVPADGVPEDERPTVLNNQLQIRVTEHMQVVRYQVTDSDGLIGWATVTVPGLTDVVPTLNPAISSVEVVAGVPKTFELSDLVRGRDDRSVRLTSEERVWGSPGTARAAGAASVEFTAPVEYSGPAAMTFEVTDGADGTDELGRTAVLTVPVKVLPAPDDPDDPDPETINLPPNANPVTLTVAAGEPARSVDLSRAVTDPEGAEVTFSNPDFGSLAGVSVGLEGNRVTGEAEPDAEVGAQLEGSVVASDGENEVRVPVTVIVEATTRPRPTAVDDAVPEAVQGQTSTVSVLDNDINPFPDTPLVITGTLLESGEGYAEIVGGEIRVTPHEDFVGTMVVRYTVEDATKLPSRQAEARIRLTVQGRPEAPGTPRQEQVSDQRAVINWTAPEDNGAPITGYTVTGTGENGDEVTQHCDATTCTITKLTNDVNYRFTVVAINRHGESDASNPSAKIRPDVRPEAPTNPAAKFGDRELELSWTRAKTSGSPVQEYEIELNGPNGRVLRTVGNVTSYTWTGLQNGSSYTFRVRAKNLAPEPSDWSARSKPEIPAGKPSPPLLVSATDSNAQTGREMRVIWDRPANPNGADIAEYRIKANSTTISVTADGERMTHTFTVPANTTYTVSITAKNKAGWSPASESTKVVVYSAPDKPSSVNLTTPNADAKVHATAKFPGTGGQSAPTHQYQINNSGSIMTFPAGGTVISGNAGTQYTIRVRSCRQDGGANKCSAWTGSNQVTAWTAPAKPTVTKSGGGTTSAKISWSVPASSNGRDINQVQIRVNGGSWSNADRSGSKSISGYDKSLKVEVRARNTENVWSEVAGDTVSTAPKPPPPEPEVTVSKGRQITPADIDAGNCPSNNCYMIKVTLKNFSSGTHKCTIESSLRDGSGYYGDFYPYSISVGSNGSGSQEGQAFKGDVGNARVKATCGSVTSGWTLW